MIDPDRFRQRAEALAELLQAKLGAKGRGIEPRLRSAMHRLPRSARGDLQVLTEAHRQLANPKLARLADPARIDTAFDSLTVLLKRIDPAERRRGVILGTLGSLVFNLLLLGGAVLAFLRWQGLL